VDGQVTLNSAEAFFPKKRRNLSKARKQSLNEKGMLGIAQTLLITPL
jgi:hypothetical protein